jgi:hypothetical protein
VIARHCLKKNGRLGRKVRVLLKVAESCGRSSYCRSGQSLVRDRANGVEISAQCLGSCKVKILHREIDDFPPIALGHREALLGESVECRPVFLSGNLEKCLDVLGSVFAGTPVGSNTCNEDVWGGSVIDLIGQRLWLDGTLGHPTILPFTCSFGGQTPRCETSRVGQGRRSRPEGQP